MQTVANGCERLRAQTHCWRNTPSTSTPPELNWSPCYAFGEKNADLFRSKMVPYILIFPLCFHWKKWPSISLILFVFAFHPQTSYGFIPEVTRYPQSPSIDHDLVMIQNHGDANPKLVTQISCGAPHAAIGFLLAILWPHQHRHGQSNGAAQRCKAAQAPLQGGVAYHEDVEERPYGLVSDWITVK